MSRLDRVFDALDPISLDELNAQARLMTRTDRKYFVPRDLLAALLDGAGDEFRVLDFGDARHSRYRTVYYDTPDFDFYRSHAQGKRHRYKVRTRTYLDSGDCLLEVKSKGYRGQTVKKRIPHDADSPRVLDEHDHGFISSITKQDASTLRPVLETIYDRTTLCHDHQRVTLDMNMEFLEGDELHHGPDDVLVETKTGGSSGPLDMMLRDAGIREHSVSKYCVAASLLYPELPSNGWHRTLRRYFGAPVGLVAAA